MSVRSSARRDLSWSSGIIRVMWPKDWVFPTCAASLAPSGDGSVSRLRPTRSNSHCVIQQRARASHGAYSRINRMRGGELDVDDERIQGPIANNFQQILRRQFWLLQNQFFDLRREHIDTANDQHVIRGTGDSSDATH